MSDFDVVLNRRNTNSAKWDKYADTDILPMWVADMDFKVPQQIIDAIKKRLITAHSVMTRLREN